MFSTFDLCLLLYVIRLAGWLKHCNLSLSLSNLSLSLSLSKQAIRFISQRKQAAMLRAYLKSCTPESANRHASTMLQQLCLTMYWLNEVASMFEHSFKTEHCDVSTHL